MGWVSSPLYSKPTLKMVSPFASSPIRKTISPRGNSSVSASARTISTSSRRAPSSTSPHTGQKVKAYPAAFSASCGISRHSKRSQAAVPVCSQPLLRQRAVCAFSPSGVQGANQWPRGDVLSAV